MRTALIGIVVSAVACAAGVAGCTTSGAVPSAVNADGHVHTGAIHVVAESSAACPICNIYETRRDVVVRIRTEGGLGTGVVIDDAGTILTNAHVVGDALVVAVETYHGTVVRGTVERRAKDVDLAIIRTAAPDVRWTGILPSAKQPPVVGSPVYVIGHPAGLGWTLTEGIISGRRSVGEVQQIELLQITAAVSPGNSGGPAFDSEQRWIGTVSSKLVGPGLENISFVIPASELRRFLDGK
jgi:S1-C subfamily serine protease